MIFTLCQRKSTDLRFFKLALPKIIRLYNRKIIAPVAPFVRLYFPLGNKSADGGFDWHVNILPYYFYLVSLW
jgi:hypothetical protein